MEGMELLQDFFNATCEDARVSPTHVSLYTVLFSLWNTGGCKNPIPVQRDELMRLSKISGRFTFYKCIKELQDFGFIKYIPSINQFLESLVYLLDPEEKINTIELQVREEVKRR